jgi:hypothetical protein
MYFYFWDPVIGKFRIISAKFMCTSLPINKGCYLNFEQLFKLENAQIQ